MKLLDEQYKIKKCIENYIGALEDCVQKSNDPSCIKELKELRRLNLDLVTIDKLKKIVGEKITRLFIQPDRCVCCKKDSYDIITFNDGSDMFSELIVKLCKDCLVGALKLFNRG